MTYTGAAGVDVTRRRVIVAAAAFLGTGCRSVPKTPQPEIRFTRIPQADSQGSDKHEIIEGSVAGARQGQRIVLYAKNGSWWLQPLLEAPFTRIQSNGKWRNATHLGTEYAALLVEPAYRPERSLQSLPAAGGAVVSVSVTKGAATSPSRLIQFSGYEWRVRNAASNRGGRNNPYSADNVWTDASGALHLRIKKNGGQFECAELALNRSLGYGTYSFHVRDVAQLAPNMNLELFTWDYSGSDQNNREMDVVVRRRAGESNARARFVLQPYQVPRNIYEFPLPAGEFRSSFRWQAGRIDFSAVSGSSRKHTFAQHSFVLGVPSPGMEATRIALYLPNSASPHPMEGEVVIDRFEYTP